MFCDAGWMVGVIRPVELTAAEDCSHSFGGNYSQVGVGIEICSTSGEITKSQRLPLQKDLPPKIYGVLA